MYSNLVVVVDRDDTNKILWCQKGKALQTINIPFEIGLCTINRDRYIPIDEQFGITSFQEAYTDVLALEGFVAVNAVAKPIVQVPRRFYRFSDDFIDGRIDFIYRNFLRGIICEEADIDMLKLAGTHAFTIPYWELMVEEEGVIEELTYELSIS